MGKKGPTRHLKRHQSPTFWPLHRKEKTWAVRTTPGPHKLKSSIPSQIILRDYLKYATTGREAKMLIKQGKLMVDGKICYDEGFPVGIMDVISLPDANENYRVLPGHSGKLVLNPISEEEKEFKLCRIKGKNTLKNAVTQLNLHDGRNIVIETEADVYKTGQVLKLQIPDIKIMDYIPFEEGVQIIVTGGRSQGERGILIGLGPEPGWKTTANVRTPRGEDIRTLARYVFTIGEKEPIISLPPNKVGED